MRKLLLLAALIGCTTAAAIQQPKPEVTVTAVAVASSTNIVVKYTVNGNGAGGWPDSLSVTIGTPGYAAHTRVHVGANAVDSVVFPNARPGVNGTISGGANTFAWRRNLQGPTATAPWTYTEPDVAPEAPSITTTATPGS